MATIITSECINCGACEPECPNTAIYAGGVEWELNGATSPALAQDIFYIVPSKCTECVGFYDHEACAAVCPVDCCVTDPNNVETEQVLLQRARVLHPEDSFADDAPSRFRKEGGAPAQAPPANGAAASANGTAAAPAPPPAAAPAPKPAAAAATPKPAAPQAAPAAAPVAAVAADASEFDPASWEVPIVCHLCNADYTIPYRHFRVGMVFYCPSCSASFVPNKTIYEAVRKQFEGFYGRRKREREEFERRRARELEQFEARQAAEMEAFREALDKMAQDMKPAGKLVKPKGLAAMFS
jgi:ferredoxin